MELCLSVYSELPGSEPFLKTGRIEISAHREKLHAPLACLPSWETVQAKRVATVISEWLPVFVSRIQSTSQFIPNGILLLHILCHPPQLASYCQLTL